MSVTAKSSGASTSPYTAKGDTLKDVWDSIKKKGLKVKGKIVAGLTSCPLAGVSNIAFDFKITKKGSKTEAEAFLKKGTVNYSCVIQVPKHSGKLSTKGAAAWKAFKSALVAHENLHVKDFAKECSAMAKDLGKLKVKATGKDEKDAKKKAEAAWKTEYGKTFSEKANKTRLDASAAKLDSGGHGPTLDTSIP